ncbi:Ig kappa chain V-II region 2S1.3 [Labeo rohita]|uniref:Ig kappa chain V-II region 2S1.3 n=1 Tax=Labeo rohita TaxID=84645 RepID=A0ABQ8LIL2_LABRO|nr:Ig kappa chain V-II region 2S1.3 [Labeo rohita]
MWLLVDPPDPPYSVQSNHSLFINKFTFDNLGSYYCTNIDRTENFGNGTRLHINGDHLAPPQHGRRQQAPASWQTAPTPPLPLGWQPPLLEPTYGTITPAPLPRAATFVHSFVLPDLLSTAIPLSSEGSSDSMSLLPPGFQHQGNEVH